MKAITIHQPFATFIVEGGRGWAGFKSVENRNWYTSHRGILLIHAGKSKNYFDQEEYDEVREERPELPKTFDELPRGAIIGAVTMTDCVKYGNKVTSPWAHGRFCWMFESPVAIEPIVIGGAQGLWIPPQEIIAQVISEVAKQEKRP